MPEYSLDFAKSLRKAAGLLIYDQSSALKDDRRACAYLCLLSTEIALKSLLERAGYAPSEIRRHSHNLKSLLRQICFCEINVEIAPSRFRYVRASEICPLPIEHNRARSTFGKVVDAEDKGASKYPNEVRYGDSFKHYHHEVLYQMSSHAIDFSSKHWDTIRRSCA